MTLIEIVEGPKQDNAVKLDVLKDMKERLNTMVNGMINEHSDRSSELSELIEKLRLDEPTTTTEAKASSPDPRESLKNMVKNARDNCEIAHKLNVSALIEQRKKASEQRKAELNALGTIQQLHKADVEDIDSKRGFALDLLCSPTTESIGKTLMDECESGMARQNIYNDILAVEVERIEKRFAEIWEPLSLGYLRERRAYLHLLAILEYQAISGVDPSFNITKSAMGRYIQEVYADQQKLLAMATRSKIVS
ncbi:hypothetical protein AA0117_g1571 [Alternaria alternata]|uniref:Uncharacterized protein n=1 Tax=Alternaria alternata TaxID=5599 RepID=A0A4Q4NW08_ALTAL|nr:hypothetical protein AA0117_g1571 [Alternaria alternata]